MRDDLAAVAQQNIALLGSGSYAAPSGARVEVAPALLAARRETRLIRPGEAAQLLAGARASPAGAEQRMEVTAESTGEAGRRLQVTEGITDVVALNFASARNPGGGYLTGARAQEEQLCRTSALYPCLLEADGYYAGNRATRSLLYTDHAIYSPRVPFFRTEALALAEAPFPLSIITSPAPNAGALKREQPDLEDRIEETLRQRSGQVLAIAEAHGHRTLILGAWGCGAFGNAPEMVAGAFGAWLEHPRFRGAFDRVVFAVFTPRPRDAQNLEAFRRRFPSPG